jgi:hypothetical protein
MGLGLGLGMGQRRRPGFVKGRLEDDYEEEREYSAGRNQSKLSPMPSASPINIVQ